MTISRISIAFCLVLCCCLTLGASEASAPPFGLALTLPNPIAETGDQFGYSVALAGTSLLVGAPFANTGATNVGSAYLFDGATGTLLQTFQKPDPAAGDWFGISVAAVGNNVLVGALGDDTGAHDAGAAYLFDGKSGALVQTFRKPNPHADDWFGGTVAAAGSNVLIGAPVDHLGDVDAGAAYLFDAKTGALLQSYFKPHPASGEWFGVSLAAVGDNVLVGAFLDHTVAKDAGAAYLFNSKTGALIRTFQKATPAAGDQFGVSVAAMGTDVLIGAPNDSVVMKEAGAAYLFDSATGALLQTFRNPKPIAQEHFGRSVAVVGQQILIGAPADNTTQTGAAYLFDATTGALLQRFQNPTPAGGDLYGFSLAAGDNRLLIAAPGDHTGTNDGGAAYLFKLP